MKLLHSKKDNLVLEWVCKDRALSLSLALSKQRKKEERKKERRKARKTEEEEATPKIWVEFELKWALLSAVKEVALPFLLLHLHILSRFFIFIFLFLFRYYYLYHLRIFLPFCLSLSTHTLPIHPNSHVCNCINVLDSLICLHAVSIH